MTAEIAILNKGAVALAADSTATISRMPNAPPKTYKSVNKLFALSKVHPVGAMIFGSPELMGVPWETIIKEYRNKLGVDSFATIEDYSTNLTKFLQSSKAIFTEDLQRRHFFKAVAAYFSSSVKNRVPDLVKGETKGRKRIKQTDIDRLTADAIQASWEKVSKSKLLPYLTATFENAVRRDYANEIKKASEYAFKGVSLHSRSRRTLAQIGSRVICGELFPDGLSGLVVAGFGEDEYFPAVKSFSPHLLVKNRLIFEEGRNSSFRVTHKSDAALIPFAQKDVVHAFVQGIDRQYMSILNTAMDEMSDRYPEIVVQHFPKVRGKDRSQIADTIRKETRGLHDALLEKIKEHVRIKHIKPLLEVISVLPKDELAAMAEALVNLTSVKRKMSLEIETVGGPIDVAVISKGDGFIWITRKRYFKPELNLHYLQSHVKGGMVE